MNEIEKVAKDMFPSYSVPDSVSKIEEYSGNDIQVVKRCYFKMGYEYCVNENKEKTFCIPVEEAAKQYADMIVPLAGLDKFDAPYITAFERYGDIEDAFGAGVKFAQRWIPVEEELPEIKTESYQVLVMKKPTPSGKILCRVLAVFSFDTPNALKDKIENKYTHWRKI